MNRSLSSCIACCLLLVVSAHAEEAPGFVPALMRFCAGGPTLYDPVEDAENRIEGGVEGPAEVGYEHIRIIGNTLRFWKKPIAGVKDQLLRRCLLQSGPHGPEPGRVILDSRTSTMPQMVFRGLFKPGEVEITRQDPDPQAPMAVRFRIELRTAGDFFGKLNTDKGWLDYGGWAETVEMNLRADIDPSTQGLIGYRFDSIHLHGRPSQNDRPRESALIMRLKTPMGEGVAAASIAPETTIAGCRSMLISIHFNADGSIKGAGSPYASQMWNPPELFGKVQMRSTSVPVVEPGP